MPILLFPRLIIKTGLEGGEELSLPPPLHSPHTPLTNQHTHTHTARLAKAAGTCHSLPRPNPFCHTVPYLQGLCALTCAARVTFAWKSSHELNLPCSHNTPCYSVISASLHRHKHSLQFKTSTAQLKLYTYLPRRSLFYLHVSEDI